MRRAELEVYAAGAALLLVTGFFIWVKMQGTAKAAQAITGGAIGAAAGVATGAVVGIGEALGVPETNMDACQLAIAEGRMWDASFACPASVFVKAMLAPKPASDAVARSATGKSTLTPLDMMRADGYVGDLPLATDPAPFDPAMPAWYDPDRSPFMVGA
jgi:hypothetical protein